MKDLAVVTSCSGYGQYLGEWASSIAAQTSKPAEVGIVVHGCAEDTAYLPSVRALLEAAGIPVAVSVVADRLDFGEARNRAVRMTSAPWCMHLDADDVLEPFALEDAGAIAPCADVIGFGFQRFGDLRAGPPNRTRLYADCDGAEALTFAAPCSGVSPFRRSFFDRSPYRLNMLGAWDTALWIGFARLGARFRATRRPVFRYRQHAGSVFNRRRTTKDLTQAVVAAELRGLRAGLEGVTVAIPYRADGGARDRALEYVRAWYAEHFPSWDVVTTPAIEPGAPWNKHDATARALAGARGAILVVADADCLVEPDAMRAAVDAVAAGAPWAIPHLEVHRLNEAETAAWYADGVSRPVVPPPDTRSLMRQPYVGYAGGGFVVCRRDRWEAVGGFPAEFTGWGCEDEALALVLTTCYGEPWRGVAPLVHLWHPKGMRVQSAEYQRNRERLRAYLAASGDAGAMFTLAAGSRRRISFADRVSASRAPERPRLYTSALSGPQKSRTLDETRAIREAQAKRNAEAAAIEAEALAKLPKPKSFHEANLAAARARRLEALQTGHKP